MTKVKKSIRSNAKCLVYLVSDLLTVNTDIPRAVYSVVLLFNIECTVQGRCLNFRCVYGGVRVSPPEEFESRYRRSYILRQLRVCSDKKQGTYMCNYVSLLLSN